MTSRFRINIDKHMFEVAEERPYIWKYLFLNKYISTGMTWSEYFSYLSGERRCSTAIFHGRLRENANIAEEVQKFCTGFVWSVTECRLVVVNLCVILEHLKGLLETHDIENTQVVKPELMEAARVGFFGIVSKIVGMSYEQLVTQADIDEDSGAITQIIRLFQTDKIFPKHVDSGAAHSLLFMHSAGDRLEQRNPCEILQSIFAEGITKLHGKPVKPEDWIVPDLVTKWPYMKTVHQCCRTVFQLSEVPMQKIDKAILAAKGMAELAPDKALVVLDELDGPYPSLMFNRVRMDLLVILKCSGYKNKREDGKWDLSPYEWKQAFLAIPTDDTLTIPLENFELIQSLAARVYSQIHVRSPIVGNLENYRLPDMVVKQEPVELKKQKTVTFAPTTRPVELKAVPQDNSLSIALLVIAAGLVTLQLRR